MTSAAEHLVAVALLSSVEANHFLGMRMRQFSTSQECISTDIYVEKAFKKCFTDSVSAAKILSDVLFVNCVSLSLMLF